MTTVNIKNEITKIMGLLKKKELHKYSFDNSNALNIISSLSTQIVNGVIMEKEEQRNFKMEYYIPLMEFIVNTIIYVYKNNEDQVHSILRYDLLPKLTSFYKGQKLLYILNKNIPNLELSEEEINNFITIASKTGTIMTFNFWLGQSNKSIKSLSQDRLLTIFINSISNSDDRLYKYLLKTVLSVNKLALQNKNDVLTLINSLASSLVPPKYILKRLKLLSQHISLVPYFNHMVTTFHSEKVLLELHKYYYVVPYTFDVLHRFINNMITFSYDLSKILSKIQNIINILKTNEEQTMLYIIIVLCNYCDIDINISLESKIGVDIVTKYADSICNMISWKTIHMNKKAQPIITILTNNNLINTYIQNKHTNIVYTQIYFLTRFIEVNMDMNPIHIKKAIRINWILHKFRLMAKKKKRTKITNHNIVMFNVLNELKTYEPKQNVKVLQEGSHIYQINKQKFTNLPPRHLMPGEITIYKDFLLREKADGILINNLPIDIFPHQPILHNYMIKAEYIEDLDLYLVFDIDIPNTTIIERYNILRNAHNNIDMIEPIKIEILEDYNNIVKKEHDNIRKFIKDNMNHTIKWYPKFACLYHYNDMNILYKQMIQDVILNNIATTNTLYKNDGIILSPLNGDREIKIKPKDMMSIDLLYNNKRWYDRSNIDWSDLIIPTDMKLSSGKIYRCYPKEDKFEVESYRYDKKKPNDTNIVDSIINIINHNWIDDIKMIETYYYGESKKLQSKLPNKLINILKSHQTILYNNINLLEPSNNMKWLDLGCGNGKLINHIKNYNPKYYMGMDIDIRQLVKCLKYHDMNQNVYNFTSCDLNSNWNNNKIKWLTIPKDITFDYIVANFSLMHFCSDIFWEQLNNVTHTGSLFLFSIVNPNKNDIMWKECDSFLKVENNITEYYFEWTHDKVMTEPYICNTMLESILKRYGWNVKSRNNSNINKLASIYEYIIVCRI
jgi:SAM-dependent methyltransferase